MNRFYCTFLSLSMLFAWACTQPAPTGTADQDAPAEKALFELRVYHLENEGQRDRIHAFLDGAMVPALNRMGSQPVGVFTPTDTAQGMDVFVLIPYETMTDYLKVQQALLKDKALLLAGANYLDAQPDDPAFQRIESTLMVAFDSMPYLAPTPLTQTHPDRIFELRSYESYSEQKGLAKVRMFNEGGEVEIFQRLGFHPVFFAQALAGDELPNLVYMTSFPNSQVQDSLWNMFRTDEAWVSIKDLPQYANSVSKIHKYILRALPASQI